MSSNRDQRIASIILFTALAGAMVFFTYRYLSARSENNNFQKIPLCESKNISDVLNGQCRMENISAQVIATYGTGGRRSRLMAEFLVKLKGSQRHYTIQISDDNFWNGLSDGGMVLVQLWNDQIMTVQVGQQTIETNENPKKKMSASLIVMGLLAGFGLFMGILIALAARRQSKEIQG